MRAMFADVVFVEMLQASMSTGVEHYHDGDNLGIGKLVGFAPVSFPVIAFQGVFLDRIVEKFAEVVCPKKIL